MPDATDPPTKNVSLARSGDLRYICGVTDQPFFSIVMPSYLAEYGGRYGDAAADRVAKFHRAIDSVLAQGFRSWELLIVSDGCEATIREAQRYALQQRIRLLCIGKQPLWSEKVRNAGIHKAEGRYIIYLDTDDVIEPDHLSDIHAKLERANYPAWGHFTDQVWDANQNAWLRRACRVNKKGTIGTSNLVHAAGQTVYWPRIEYRWPDNGYDHDWQFARTLPKLLGPGVDLGDGGYRVMHIPRQYDL